MTGNRFRDCSGTTLLELAFAMGIFTIVMGVLFTLSLSIGNTATLQEVKVIANDEGRRALIGVIPRLRQAQRASINMDEMPTDVLRFRMPADLDGNGLAINASNTLELGPEITIRRDLYDQNKDGLVKSQLIWIDGENIRVLANNLSPDAAPPPPEPGSASPPENTAGFWVDEVDGRVSVTVRTQGKSRQGHVIRQEYTQTVEPRN